MRTLDYERAVVVDAEGQNKTNETTLRSEGRSALKKDLTGPTLLEMSGSPCRLRWSTQHSLEVYSQGSRILRSFSAAHSSAARPGRAALENRQTARCLGGSIAVIADWCFRSCPVARDFADRRSRPSHPWLR